MYYLYHDWKDQFYKTWFPVALPLVACWEKSIDDTTARSLELQSCKQNQADSASMIECMAMYASCFPRPCCLLVGW